MKPGLAFVINGYRAISSAREIRRGRNKNKWEVVLLNKFKGKRKVLVNRSSIKEMPEDG